MSYFWTGYIDYLKSGNVVEEAMIIDKFTGIVHASSIGLIRGQTIPSYTIQIPAKNHTEPPTESTFNECD